MKTFRDIETKLEKLLPKEINGERIDIIYGGRRILCSRQAIVHFIKEISNQIIDDMIGGESHCEICDNKEMNCGCEGYNLKVQALKEFKKHFNV